MSSGGRFLFDDFELRPDSGELFHQGAPVKLQPQPARVLELLARNAPEVVTREELRRHLWGEDTFVDFEHGLNFSIRQLRRALGDAADAPRFVETVPRRGYRFLPAVRLAADLPAGTTPPVPRRPLPRLGRRAGILAGRAVALLLLLALQPKHEMPGSPSLLPPGVPRTAWDAYVEGRFLTRWEAPPGDRAKGIASLQRAVLMAPRFAAAYTALARAEERAPDKPPVERFPIAETAARRAVAIDPGQAEAHLVLARVHFLRDLDPRQAGLEVERALQADPKLAAAFSARADYLAILGRHDEAIRASERARALDPEGQLTAQDLLCYHFFLARRWQEAIQCGRRIAGLLPADSYDGFHARLWVLNAASRQGDVETALAAARDLVAASADTFPAPGRLQSLRDFWAWDLARREAAAQHGPRSVELALDLIALGENRNRALDLLQQAFERRDFWFLPFLGVDPRFDPLRGEPRFQRLLGQIRIPPAAEPPGLNSLHP